MATIGFIGSGLMTQAWAARFAAQGNQIVASDTQPSRLEDLTARFEDPSPLTTTLSNEKVARESDILIYSTPPNETPRIIKDSVGYARSGSLISTFTSSKSAETEMLLRYAPTSTEIVTLHPMFAPSVTPHNQNVFVIPLREYQPSLRERLEEPFRYAGCNLVEVGSAQEHDVRAAHVQGFTHFARIAEGIASRAMGLHPQNSADFSTPVYRAGRLMTERIFEGNPAVYANTTMGNPEALPLITAYVKAVNDLFGMVSSGDAKGFRDEFQAVKDFFGPDWLAHSKQESDSLIRKMSYTEEKA